MIVMDDRTCMVDVARYFLAFLIEESCGKCTPCREGLRQMLTIYDDLVEGRGRNGDLERIERLEEEKKETAEQIKEVYAEAKSSGFDAKTIRKVVSLRKKPTEERQEEEALLDLYLSALGMLPS